MTTLTQQPSNINTLYGSNFLVQFSRLPNLQFFCTLVVLPDITVGEVLVETPISVMKIPGEKATYGQIQMTFIVDENLKNFNEIYQWIIGLTAPDKFDQFGTFSTASDTSLNTEYSDMSIFLFSSNNNPITEIKFKDVWPSNLSPLTLNTGAGSEPVAADVSININGSMEFNFL